MVRNLCVLAFFMAAPGMSGAQSGDIQFIRDDALVAGSQDIHASTSGRVFIIGRAGDVVDDVQGSLSTKKESYLSLGAFDTGEAVGVEGDGVRLPTEQLRGSQAWSVADEIPSWAAGPALTPGQIHALIAAPAAAPKILGAPGSPSLPQP